MRKILNRVSKKILAFEKDQRNFAAYENMMAHPGWPIHVEYLMLIRGLIATELLSPTFTKLDANEKDVVQRNQN